MCYFDAKFQGQHKQAANIEIVQALNSSNIKNLEHHTRTFENYLITISSKKICHALSNFNELLLVHEK